MAQPASQPLYDVKPPSEDPERQQHYVRAADGVQLWVESWLPKAAGSNAPPARVPTILHMSPYLGTRGIPGTDNLVGVFVPRGFAYAAAHVRGSGESGGCLDQIGAHEPDDAARVIEYLGREAPWSDGNVGMYGLSYPGGVTVAAAARGDKSRARHLKAIVAAAPFASMYDNHAMDGVPYFATPLANTAIYLGISAAPSDQPSAQHHAERPGCQPEVLTNSVHTSGNYTDFADERESRRGASTITAATLMVHGYRDVNVAPIMQAGLFERIPASTPKAAIFGVFGHHWPDEADSVTRWRRPDMDDVMVAWFDRYLKDLYTGLDHWPTVQVQGSDGQWRGEPDWPTTGGPVGHLALGPSGELGTPSPTGTTGYQEVGPDPLNAQAQPERAATFVTAPLPERLEITGQPVLDLWVSLDRDDAHVAASLQALDATGEPIRHARAYGLRSVRHLEPLVENRFAQRQEKAPPVGSPVHVPVRLQPTDLVVPEDGRLRLVVSGATPLDPTTETSSQPSLSLTRVTILHDCAHPSALRFLMARPEPDLLRIEANATAGSPPARHPARRPVADAGGLATASVCGRPPIRLESFGPPRPYPADPTAGDRQPSAVTQAARRTTLVVRPRTARARRRTTFRFRARTLLGGRKTALAGAVIRFAGRRLRTDRRGAAKIRIRFRSPGRRVARLTPRGERPVRVVMRVTAPPRRAGSRRRG